MQYNQVIARLAIAEHIDQTRLREALTQKDAVALGQLIREDNSIVNTKIEGHPLLVAAFLYSAEDIIFMLLHNGADPTIPGDNGKSLIDYVVNSGQSMARSLVHTLKRFGYPIETESETHGAIREKFDFEGFKVINAGLRDKEMQQVLNPISNICRKMRKFGFDNLLYGPLIITSKDLHGQTYNDAAKKYVDMSWGAYYEHNKDLVVINATNFLESIPRNMQLFAHELAHRQWFKFMDSSQRQLWTGKFHERGDAIEKSLVDYIWELAKKATPYKTDNLGFAYYGWDQFDYARFISMVKAKQEKYRLMDVLNTAATHGRPVESEENMKTVRRKFVLESLLEGEMYGGGPWAAQKMDSMSSFIKGDIDLTNLDKQPALKRLIEHDSSGGKKEYDSMKEAVRSLEPTPNQLLFVAGKPRQDPLSSTEYGKNNSAEDYAEAFGNFMANHPMPKELYEQFVRVNNLKLAKNKLCAENSPKNAVPR